MFINIFLHSPWEATNRADFVAQTFRGF